MGKNFEGCIFCLSSLSTYMGIGNGSLHKRPGLLAGIASHDIWEVWDGDWNLQSRVRVILRFLRVTDTLADVNVY